jgi:hypothetical protein
VSDLTDFTTEVDELGAADMADIADWTEAVNGGGGGTFPTFTGAGNPEGVQVGNYGDTYVDSTTGVIFGKQSATNDGTAVGWGFDMEGLVQIGQATGATYTNPPRVFFATGGSDWTDDNYIAMGTGDPLYPVNIVGLILYDNLTSFPAGVGGVQIGSEAGGVAIFAGQMSNAVLGQVDIDAKTVTNIGTASGSVQLGGPGGHVGVFGATPVTKAAAITPPTGGGTVDSQARTAINALITVIQNFGITA